MLNLHLLTSDGERIPVSQVGEGSPIIVLHGWTSSQQEWLPYGQALAKQSKVYCWTARGHGDHQLQTIASVTLPRMAQDLREFIAHYGLTRVVLLGHSMGALTVWEYIRQFGCSKLAGICIVDQSPRLLTDDTWKLGIYGHFSFADNQRFVTGLKADFPEAVLQLGARGNNPRVTRSYQQNTSGIQALRNYLQCLQPEPLIHCWESLTAADYRSVLPTVSVPTLLIYGSESQFYSQAVAHYVRNAISGSLLHIYENTDHFPHLWQKTRFIADVEAFVDALS